MQQQSSEFSQEEEQERNEEKRRAAAVAVAAEPIVMSVRLGCIAVRDEWESANNRSVHILYRGRGVAEQEPYTTDAATCSSSSSWRHPFSWYTAAAQHSAQQCHCDWKLSMVQSFPLFSIAPVVIFMLCVLCVHVIIKKRKKKLDIIEDGCVGYSLQRFRSSYIC